MALAPLLVQNVSERTTASDRPLGVDHVLLGQEIHDLIGHKLSLMVLHASVLETEGGPAAERATVIRETGHAAIVGLRDILAVLTDDGQVNGLLADSVPADSVPEQRSEQDARMCLDELINQSRVAGLPVRTRITGGLDRLRPELTTAMCCVVREALTNVHKHAGIVPTTVRVDVGDSAVTIEIRNRRPAGRPATACVGSHRGLRGMGRRVRQRGGRLAHESTSDGGFLVRAELPL